jgi:hypothetical protein
MAEDLAAKKVSTMKIVIVDKSNINQKMYYTNERGWDHQIRNAKDFKPAEARRTLKALSIIKPLVEIQIY